MSDTRKEAAPQPEAAPLDVRVSGSVEEMGEAEVAFLLENPDPDMRYVFVQERSANLRKKQIRGLRPVSASEDGVRLMAGASYDGHADDFIRVGDTILMCEPKQRAKLRKEKIRRKSEARLGGAEEKRFQKKSQEKGARLGMGVKVYVDSGDE